LRLLRKDDDDGNDEEDSATKAYIKGNPELEKILKDLYDDTAPTKSKDQLPSEFATKFDVYKDEDSPVIYDIDEERAIRMEQRERRAMLGEDEEHADEEEETKIPAKYAQFNLKESSITKWPTK